MADVTTIDVPGFPQDVLNAANIVEDEIMNADISEIDTQYIIDMGYLEAELMAEVDLINRERVAA